VNDDPKLNGEYKVMQNASKHLTVFDIGAANSIFVEYEGEVHYFDPIPGHIENLKRSKTKNTKSFFNNFGLSNKSEVSKFYPQYQSFLNRSKTFDNSQEDNYFNLKTETGDWYIEANNIARVDFLKIDVEGFEFDVLRGFERNLGKISVIQFEYGGTFLDKELKLSDVCGWLLCRGFKTFSYITDDGYVPVCSFRDHYNYCNIMCNR